LTVDEFEVWAEENIKNSADVYPALVRASFEMTFIVLDASPADKAFLKLKYSEYL
jgi:hypothetical protein